MKERFRQENGDYHIFTTRVPRNMWDSLRTICFLKKISVASFMRDAVENHLNFYEKVVDRKE